MLSGIIPAFMMAAAAPVAPGAINYTVPGTYTFVVPNYNTMTVDVKGASGGGAGAQRTTGSPVGYWYAGSNGASGGLSRFLLATIIDLLAQGGIGGIPGPSGNFPAASGTNGADGAAAGGDTNTTGGGATPGGTGGDTKTGEYHMTGGKGGKGGRAQSTILKSSGLLVPGASVTVIVGALGAAGVNGAGSAPAGDTAPTAGVAGSVAISWT